MNAFRFPLTAGLAWAVAVSATAQSFTATDRQPTPEELAKIKEDSKKLPKLQTPEEIAVSIAAEMIKVRAERRGRHAQPAA